MKAFMQALDVIFAIIILVMSVVIHEVSHGFVADILGDPTARLAGRLTLNPFKHLDLIGSFIVPLITFLVARIAFGWAKPVPYNPYNLRAGRWGPAIVAVAGPAANLVVAIVFGLIVRFGVGAGVLASDGAFVALATTVVFINVVLAIFNLIPIPPLDGSKILFAGLSYRYNNIVAFLERNQLILVLILLLFFWQFFIPVITFVAKLILGG